VVARTLMRSKEVRSRFEMLRFKAWVKQIIGQQGEHRSFGPVSYGKDQGQKEIISGIMRGRGDKTISPISCGGCMYEARQIVKRADCVFTGLSNLNRPLSPCCKGKM
jgi:hypothetical protein